MLGPPTYPLSCQRHGSGRILGPPTSISSQSVDLLAVVVGRRARGSDALPHGQQQHARTPGGRQRGRRSGAKRLRAMRSIALACDGDGGHHDREGGGSDDDQEEHEEKD